MSNGLFDGLKDLGFGDLGKEEIIEKILEFAKDKFSKEELNLKSLPELQEILSKFMGK